MRSRRCRGPVRATLLLAAACGLTPALQAQVARFDTASGLLTIPAVGVGPASFTEVKLLHTGNFRFALQGAQPQLPAAPAAARFDTGAGVLSLPAVQVGAETYLDVTLLHHGNYSFSLQNARPLAPETLAGAAALLQAADALYASRMPTSGAERMSLVDACFLHEGRSRDWTVQDTDAQLAEFQARDAYLLGRSSRNLQVLAERRSTNPDGSSRHELDVQYDVAYADGSRDLGVQYTLISGSSQGTPHCSTAQTGSGWRFLGNRRLVQVAVRARNLRDERYNITSGVAQFPAVTYRRELRWLISDPLGRATYVIVSGPGPVTTVNGAGVPFSLKMLSTRVLRSAPELSGRPGSYLNWRDDDGFRYCLAPGGGSAVPVAQVADCLGQGASADNWGHTSATPDAAADAVHDAMGFVAGGTYVFQVYDDDGWKTVNGHANRTPIATYSATLGRLSYRFTELAGSSPATDRFPRLSFPGQSLVQVRNNVMGIAPGPMKAAWSAPGALPDTRPFRLFQLWEYFHGAKLGNLGNASFPGYRYIRFHFPGSIATSLDSLPVSARPAELSGKSYNEFTLQYLDRNDSEILSRVSLF